MAVPRWQRGGCRAGRYHGDCQPMVRGGEAVGALHNGPPVRQRECWGSWVGNPATA